MKYCRVYAILFLMLFEIISACNATGTPVTKPVTNDVSNGQTENVIDPPPMWALNVMVREGFMTQEAVDRILYYCQHPDSTQKIGILDDFLMAIAAAAAVEAVKITVTYAVDALANWVPPHLGPSDASSPFTRDNPWQ
jgi:hypothetical protein